MDEISLRIAGRGDVMRPCTDAETAKLAWVPRTKDGIPVARPMKLVTEEDFVRSLVKTFPTDVERRAYSNECRTRYQKQLADLRRDKDLRVREDGYVEFLVDLDVDKKTKAQ
jgi:hypothetical protein